MGKIVLLDELTINQIAAGEVIERPASVIKEMVENSIDAGAKHIVVEIKNGGISYIRVSDDGKGIEKDDVEMAFERHATSKIRSAADLQDVKSMGFRGEALASVAAIANVELISRTENESTGTKITVEGGDVLNIEEVAASKGTVITVRNLFFNTPVRYKFLKKDFTETGYIEDVMERIALVHPEISIKLINSGKTVLQTNGNGDIKSVIYSIYGKDTADEILPVEYEYEYIKVKGVIGKPAIARSNRSNQIFFVNKRYIKDKTLSSAAEQGYKGLIPIGKFAFLILNLEMNPSKVDVNVHPAKLEVRFEEESVVFKAVYHAIKNTLLSADLISEREKHKEEKDAIKDAFKIQDYQKESNNGGLFGRKQNDFTDNSINTSSFNEMDVFEKLRKLQENLKNEVEANPNLKLTDDYKQMEEKYKELTTATKELKNNLNNTENVKEDNLNEESKNIKTDNELIEDDKNSVENKNSENNIIEEIYAQRQKEQENNSKQEISDFNSKEEKHSENKVDKNEYGYTENEGNIENQEKNDKAEEQVKEKILSFEEMYRELFGKEPYGGRRPVENIQNIKKEDETKKEDGQVNYSLDDNMLNENISVFEDVEEYNKPTYRIIGIAFKTYIILEMKNELFLMDQHAAHERILYEKVKANYMKDEEKESQLLLLPDLITLKPREMDLARENMDMFRKAGFMLEEFDDHTIKISGVPDICIDLDTKDLFLETLDQINAIARTAKQEKEERFMATVACKAAVKAGMDLSMDEVVSIIDQLLVLKNPFSCPHGRPTVIKMSKYEIERKFARK